MKKQLTILVIISVLSISSYGQIIIQESFNFGKLNLRYDELTFTQGSIRNFYVVINNGQNNIREIQNKLNKCRPASAKIYVCNIPKDADIDKQKFLLEFISYITNRTKLIDSNLIVIADDDYTALYNSIKLEKNNYYKHGHLNDIKEHHFFKNFKNICDVIK